jgi:hypothetical protein
MGYVDNKKKMEEILRNGRTHQRDETNQLTLLTQNARHPSRLAMRVATHVT